MVLPPFPLKEVRLGLELNDENQVTAVLPGSWAAEAGVVRRDAFVQANEIPLDERKLAHAPSGLQGREIEEVRLVGRKLDGALAELRQRDVEEVRLVLARRVANKPPPVVPRSAVAALPVHASMRRRKPEVLEEPEEPTGPSDSQRRRNAARVSDLLLELDDEKDGIDALYAEAHRALSEWAVEFTAVRHREPTRAEVREGPVWPFVKVKTSEAEVRRGALNQTLATMGQELMPQPSAGRQVAARGKDGGEGATGLGHKMYQPYSGERSRLTLLRALEPNVLQPPEATAELRSYFCTMALAAESAGAAGVENAFSSTDDEELEQAALLLAHFDADSDGLLARDEFVALLGLVAAKAGHTYSDEHLAAMFTEADLDCNEVLDLNELLLLLRGDVVQGNFLFKE